MITDELDEIMGWTSTSYEGEKAWELVGGRMSGTDYRLALLRIQGYADKQRKIYWGDSK
tara:strand:+ start:308 stop:484 length:177 start_codon:yes stop_codon:yes gene_type:complete